MSVASYPLALVASLLFAVSATLQQASARAARLRAVADASARPWLPIVGVLGRLLREPRWLAGWALNVAGFVAHALALHLGSITVVQALLTVQLLFALAVTTVVRQQRFLARDWAGTLAVTAGAALVAVSRGPVAQAVPPLSRVVQTALAATLTIAAIVTIARLIGGGSQLRSALVAAGAGIAFCTTAVFVVVVTDELAHGGVAAGLRWPSAALIGSAVVGSLLVQDSFANGSLPTALTTMTVTDPVVSCLVGLALFDVVRIPTTGDLTALLAAGVLITIGVVALANSPNLRETATGSGPAP